MNKEQVTPLGDLLVCKVADPRKVMETQLIVPVSGMNRQGRRANKGKDDGDAAATAGNELIIEVVGTGEEIAKFDPQLAVGDRIAVANVLLPIVVNCEQLLLIHAHDVLAKIENWTPVDKVKTLLS